MQQKAQINTVTFSQYLHVSIGYVQNLFARGEND